MKMSLKQRLAWVVAILMSLFVLTYSGVLFSSLGQRADAETDGSLPWIVALLPDHLAPDTPQAEGLARLSQLVRQLEAVRHVHVALHGADGQLIASAPSEQADLPPWWPAPELGSSAVRKDVQQDGRVVAYFVVRPTMGDEWSEVWQDYTRSIGLVAALALVTVLAIVGYTFQALKPLDRMRRALRTMEAGEKPEPLPPSRSAEVDEIATAFNRMASAVAMAQAERQTLMRRLLDGEEHTRRSVAHDLHDELSPYLVALQPLARSLQRRCAGRADLADIGDSVETLVSHQTRILSSLRHILTGLHPPELETLGLRGALQQLAAWSPGGEDAVPQVQLSLEGDWHSFGETLDVSIYRMVQECVTNARRHSGGRRVDIRVRAHPPGPDAGAGEIFIEVLNDCASSFATGARAGLGTLGIRDRCVALGGCFESGPSAPHGWRVSIHLPWSIPVEAAQG